MADGQAEERPPVKYKIGMAAHERLGSQLHLCGRRHSKGRTSTMYTNTPFGSLFRISNSLFRSRPDVPVFTS
jgi:hypothetical protein